MGYFLLGVITGFGLFTYWRYKTFIKKKIRQIRDEIEDEDRAKRDS